MFFSRCAVFWNSSRLASRKQAHAVLQFIISLFSSNYFGTCLIYGTFLGGHVGDRWCNNAADIWVMFTTVTQFVMLSELLFVVVVFESFTCTELAEDNTQIDSCPLGVGGSTICTFLIGQLWPYLLCNLIVRKGFCNGVPHRLHPLVL